MVEHIQSRRWVRWTRHVRWCDERGVRAEAEDGQTVGAGGVGDEEREERGGAEGDEVGWAVERGRACQGGFGCG